VFGVRVFRGEGAKFRGEGAGFGVRAKSAGFGDRMKCGYDLDSGRSVRRTWSQGNVWERFGVRMKCGWDLESGRSSHCFEPE